MTRHEPVWTSDQLASDPHAAEDKARRVRAMFDAIAPSYDLNNRIHSMWRDQAWRREAVRVAQPTPGSVVLDVACGTGDLAMAFRKGGANRVIGVDFVESMLQFADHKRKRDDAITYHVGDATSLPIADSSVDIVSIAFGIRNVNRPQRAIAEFHRVLKPGGRVIVLEFSQPTNPVMRRLYQFYSGVIMPRTASWIARDRSNAYRYLPRSVDTFLDRDAMCRLLSEAGFSGVTLKPLTMGVAVIYRGVK